jgi:hypothetical protein
MRKLVEELEVSEWFIRKIVKEDIRYRSYSLRRGQFLSTCTKKPDMKNLLTCLID